MLFLICCFYFLNFALMFDFVCRVVQRTRNRSVKQVHHAVIGARSDVARIARIVAERAIALALGGGAGRGLAHCESFFFLTRIFFVVFWFHSFKFYFILFLICCFYFLSLSFFSHSCFFVYPFKLYFILNLLLFLICYYS